MKTKEYVKKYNLMDKDSHLDHDKFVADLKADFDTMVEFHKKTGWNFNKFKLCIKDIGHKFDSIAHQTKHRHISTKLFGFFYATVIGPMKTEMFGGAPKTAAHLERMEERAKSVR